MNNYRVLHIGINSSVPIIFNIISEKIFILYNPTIQKILKEQEDIETIVSSLNPDSKLYVFRRSKEIKKIVKDKNINIIFINRKDDMVAAKLAFLFKRKRPLIIGTFHNPKVWINDKKVKAFIPLMKMCLDGHLSMASFAYNKLLKFNYPKERIIFFQNYIRFETFEQKNDYHSGEIFKICYSGTINPRKNELFVAKVINELKNKYRIQYDVYGPFNNNEYKNEFLQYVEDNKLTSIVNFYPRLAPLDERQALLGHDLYLSASNAEMCPLNILNAKACAMPILISDSFGQQDLIKNEIDGMKFKENDIDDAKNKLEQLINDSELRKKIGINAYKAVSETDSYLVASKRLETFIEQLNNRMTKRSGKNG